MTPNRLNEGLLDGVSFRMARRIFWRGLEELLHVFSHIRARGLQVSVAQCEVQHDWAICQRQVHEPARGWRRIVRLVRPGNLQLGLHREAWPPHPNKFCSQLPTPGKLFDKRFGNHRGSDAKPEQCGELQFLATNDPSQLAAFRTPSLRNVAERAPYMHAGQFTTLEQVVQHYAASPKAVLGHSELAQPGEKHAERQAIRLTAAEVQDVAAFLGTLTGPVVQAK